MIKRIQVLGVAFASVLATGCGSSGGDGKLEPWAAMGLPIGGEALIDPDTPPTATHLSIQHPAETPAAPLCEAYVARLAGAGFAVTDRSSNPGEGAIVWLAKSGEPWTLSCIAFDDSTSVSIRKG